MKILLHLSLIPMLIPSLVADTIPQLVTKPVVFTVTDHSGSPVPEALVEASLPGPGNASGRTDSSGQATLYVSAGATLHVQVSKNGYYATGGEIWIGGIYRGPQGNMIAREIPDELTVVLKPVLNPVPMKATRYWGRVPATGRAVGFDLDIGDWIEPHGTGRVADLLFHCHINRKNPDGSGSILTLLFPNKGDGIQPFQAARPYSVQFGSNLAPPHEAPVTGYRPSLTRTFNPVPGETLKEDIRSWQNYIVRTRTVMDAGGTIRQACYGWIAGEISFDPRDPGGPQLSFNAWLNPDPHPDSRSLEKISGKIDPPD